MEANNIILQKFIEDQNHDCNHYWGDSWQYWSDLYDAISEMRVWINKSHVLVYEKEKYGTYRFDILQMYDGTLKSWLQPTVRTDFDWYFHNAWVYHNMHGLYSVINKVVTPCVNAVLKIISKVDRVCAKAVPSRFIKWVNNWQLQILNEGFQKTCYKYPHIVNELLVDVDCYSYIKPYGDYIVDGEVIHDKYWKSVLSRHGKLTI